MNYYGQALEDKFLNEHYFKNKKNGIYIELGAFNGTFQSNTKWLEDEFEWGGILIEPSLNAYNQCCRTRPHNKLFNCACVSNEYKEETINDLVDGKYYILDAHYEQVNNSLETESKTDFVKFKEYFNSEDKEFVTKLKRECELVLLNNR